jgi:tRNA nucleotidyltransferase (CCA-adding enzyme)
MDIVTTHLNADFDCLGAMVAVRRLYPEAIMVFAGSQEKGVRDFLVRSGGQVIETVRPRDVDMGAVTRLIMVDCQEASRIGPFAELTGRPGVELVIYDHHPSTSESLKPDAGVIRTCGSTSALVACLLMEQGLELTAPEATMVMLGIYEDTGNLTFATTTVDDFRAAAWLLQQGTDLGVVAESVAHGLTPPQVALLNTLLQSLRVIPFHGVDVAIAEASLESYLGDVAGLAHMILDMENLDALFMVVGMGARVYLVGRSRIPEVNVGAVLRSLGGGGHGSAASATLRDITTIQARARLEEAIARFVSRRYVAAEIMSSPVKTVTSDITMDEAQEALVRYNLNAMPVVRGDEMVGVITRRVLEKALFHGLGAVRVSDYMHTEFMRAAPDTPLSEIHDYFATRDRRLVPVFRDDDLVGVVTRTDLLRFMASGQAGRGEQSSDLGQGEGRFRQRSIIPLINRQLPPHIVELLRQAGEVGETLGLQIYAVGGFVRDLLLRQENLDIDLTVEGDGILFAEVFAERMGCRVRRHDAFGTAVVIFPDGRKLDVASTRLEYYDAPGALPTVERSSLKLDLYRRDFTINTLAIILNPPDFGRLHDYFGAWRDLEDRVIRVLHNLSFVEDPTRVFRAVRFEQRLGFRISAHTELLIRNAVKMDFPVRVGGKRLQNELQILLREAEPRRSMERLSSLDLLKYIHPDIVWDGRMDELFVQSRRVLDWYGLLYRDEPCEPWLVYFLALTANLSENEIKKTMKRLAFPSRIAERLHLSLVRAKEARREMLPGQRGAKSGGSRLYHALETVTIEVVLHIMALKGDGPVRRFLAGYVTALRDEKCILSGRDLLEMGIAPGESLGRLMSRLLDARLDGEVKSREEEAELARKLAGETL